MNRQELYAHYSEVFFPRYCKGEFGGLDIPHIHPYKSWSKAKLQEAYDINCQALEQLNKLTKLKPNPSRRHL